jgi:hypothetical protein
MNIGQANKILEQAKENQEEIGNGAVGGLNPYESSAIEEPPEPPSTVPAPTPASRVDSTQSTNSPERTESTGPRSSRTVTITSGEKLLSSDSRSSDSEYNETKPTDSNSTTENGGANNKTTGNNPRNGSGAVTFV